MVENEKLKKKMWNIHTHTHTHTHNEILLSYQKEWNDAIRSNMDGPRDYHIRWSKSERERQIPYDITCTWNLKYDTNELIYKTETWKTNSWLSKGKGDGGVKN